MLVATADTLPEDDKSWLGGSVEMAFMSGYLEQGMLINDEAVWQPSLTLEAYGLAFNVWGNFDFTKAYSDEAPAFTEAVYTISYSGQLAPLAYSIGFSRNTYPNSSEEEECGEECYLRRRLKPSHALYGYVEYPDLLVVPALTAEYTFNWEESFYLQFALTHEREISQELAAELTAALGWGSADFHSVNYNEHQAALNEAALTVALLWSPVEDLTLKASLTYSYLVDKDVADTAKECGFKSPAAMVGGLTLEWQF